MGMKVRTEVSRRKEYWIPKHRHLELVHFCLQYPEWQAQLRDLDGYFATATVREICLRNDGYISKPVEDVVERRMELGERVEMIEQAAKDSADDLWLYLLKGVTEGVGYERLPGIPCCKDVYYQIYRKFFWLLDKSRK